MTDWEISPADRERLQRSTASSYQLAQALGQDPAILAAIAEGTVHPIMAAYGLWRDEEDLADLASEIERNRAGGVTG